MLSRLRVFRNIDFPRGGWRRLCALALAMFFASGRTWAEDCVPVRCPALLAEDRIQANGPGGPSFPVSLIALGTTKAIDGPAGGSRRTRLVIEEVLYGDRSLKTVEMTGLWEEGHRAIFYLVPTGRIDGPEWEEYYTWKPEDLFAARFLAAARFTELVLNSDSIVIGEDTNEHPEKWKTTSKPSTQVKVSTSLSGEKIPENQVITLEYAPHPFAGPQIYFLRGKHYADSRTPVYEWRSALPVQRQDDVRAILAKRNTFPPADDPWKIDRKGIREIVFDGTAKQALDLLISENEAAQLLGKRFFLHHPADARAQLVPPIESALFRTSQAKDVEFDEFERQRYRIQALGLAEQKEPTGVIAELAEKLIATLETSPPPAPISQESDRLRDGWFLGRRVEMIVDVNHTLVWLLQQLPEEEVKRRWGERLVLLKGRLTEWWQQEVALAVDELLLETARELADGLARMKAFKPVRSTEDLVSIAHVYFSDDNRRLWSIGGDGTYSHWDAATLKMLDRQHPPAGTELLSFSRRDGKYLLYVENDKSPPESGSLLKVSAIAAESGAFMASMEFPLTTRKGKHRRVGWIAGGQVVVQDQGKVSLVDVVHGKILREFACQDYPRLISPDRRFVLTGFWGMGREYLLQKIDLTTGAINPLPSGLHDHVTLDGAIYEHLDDPGDIELQEAGRPEKMPNLRRLEVLEIVTSADHRRVAIVTRQLTLVDGDFRDVDPNGPTIVRIYDVQSLALIGALEAPNGKVKPFFNKDGSQVALVYDAKTIERWPLPE